MTITVVTAVESYDLTELATVKAEMGITGSTDDTFIFRLITVASDAITTYCNRQFALARIKETMQSQGGKNLALSYFPLITLHTLKYKTVAVTAADYYVERLNAGIITNIDFWENTDQLFSYEADYTYGYVLPSYTATSTLPAAIEQAAIDTVRAMYMLRARDTTLLTEELPQVYKAAYSSAASMGGGAGLPAYAASL